MDRKYINNAKLFKALSDSNRLIILEILSSGEKCACKLLEALNINQSTLSHHMSILCEAKIVTSRKEGKWTHYKICEDGCNELITIIKNLI